MYDQLHSAAITVYRTICMCLQDYMYIRTHLCYPAELVSANQDHPGVKNKKRQ